MNDPTARTLTDLFVPHLPGAEQPAARALGQELERALEAAVGRFAAAATGGDPAADDLLGHLARRLPDGWEPGTIERLHLEDLALAWGCARGSPRAIAEVEHRHFAIVDAALGQLPDAAAQREEIKQRLRLRLFVSAPGKAPRIAQYSGRGALKSWLRVAAIRCALDLLARRGREVALDDEVLEQLAAPGQTQDLLHLKQTYRAEFKQSFEGALAALSSRDRNILRYRYLRRLTVEQVGEIYGVHRITASRWLARIRDSLLTRTRRALMEQLSIEQTEFESIMRLIDSELDASIKRFLEP